MPKVLVLPDHIASQIAAGEVVERPSSVVKELVENSLDAGATEIEVTVSADCRDIRIADNGCGMTPEDAVLAFQRHATSKLRSAEDLWSLTTLGFRGEALPSIASISRFTCYSRTHDGAVGSKVESADGHMTASETGCAPGTVMEINELFYNTPARLKFMKKATTEYGHIEEIVQSLAISYPEVAFTLIRDGDVSLRTTGSGNLATAIVQAKFFTGKESVIEVLHQEGLGGRANGIKIKGLLAKPLHFRGDRKGILTIVNRRAVRCPLTYKALDYVYSDLIPRGRYPLAVVTLELDPSVVDVNIHPTKKELKYQSGNEIYITIQRALAATLRQNSMQEAAAYHAARADRAEADDRAQEQQSFDPHYQNRQASTTSDRPGRSTAVAATQISFRDNLDYKVSPATPVQKPAREAALAAYSADITTGEVQIVDNYDALTQNHNRALVSESATTDAVLTESLPKEDLLSEDSDGNGILNGDSSISIIDQDSLSPAYSDNVVSTSQYAAMHGSDNPEAGTRIDHDVDSSTEYSLPAGWRIMGYLHNTWIFFETPEGLEIIEQHIAHERTLYERLLKAQITAGRITEHCQRLVISSPLDLSPEQLETLKVSQEALAKLGFEFVINEDNSAGVMQVPLELARVNYRPVIQRMLDELATVDATNLELEATKSIACQSAIKNGMTLSMRDILKLISDWLDTERNDTCPHGRPIRLKFTKTQIFEMFHPA
ncbi:MAG: DNA mismatch repair endonuclease MutL [Candidatus Obscuribacter sp.]|jgi:DNA mismatch repair protein MutL|nr:DNA mismatch repair endonuclease MutL [Candidatus Obscuribacter sp.]MBP6594770.1 DNA mismatch repair endonuclease MutL [Candidatus Obscuribacter sp.]